jgi:hydroxymethylbilane synthase
MREFITPSPAVIKEEKMKKKITIGTRGSMLALWQAEWIKSLILELRPELEVELMKIKTTGDKIQDVPLAMVGGKGLFVKEIEEAMMRDEIDLAVHSMKDVPTVLPEGLYIGVITKREDPRDAFISNKYKSLKDMPDGSTIGTSSLRRSCQLKSARGGIKIENLRGNVDTRLRKLDENQYDAIILAAAGVRRLGFTDRISELLDPTISLPAIAQGAVGIEYRQNDEFINELLAPLRHNESEICVTAERACLAKLEGGCQVPIAAHAVLNDEKLIMDGLVGNLAGDVIIKAHAEGNPDDAEAIGVKLAEELLAKGAKEILDEVYAQGI